MDVNEKMIQSVLDEASAEKEQLLSQNKEVLSTLLEEEEQKQKVLFEKEEQKILKEIKHQKNRKFQQLENVSKSKILSVQQEFLDQLFAESLANIEALSAEEFLQFTQSAFEKLPQDQQGVVWVGEKSEAVFAKEILVQFPNITLSEKNIPQKSGFLVDFSGIEYNFLFENLLQETRMNMQVAIKKEIWG